jgi:cytochrome c-type protein NapC
LNNFHQLRKWIFAYAYWAVGIAGLVLGVLLWGAFNWSMELTNNERFCVSCHSMYENILPEYQQSAHFLNSSGVRASCPDCHVPKEWGPMLIRKIQSSRELYFAATGSINTREKFLQRRQVLAERVWTHMQKNDSKECRNCHHFDYMNLAHQDPRAAHIHRNAREHDQTCIDCHKGIAHQLPEMFLEQEHQRFDAQGIECTNCHLSLGNWYQD